MKIRDAIPSRCFILISLFIPDISAHNWAEGKIVSEKLILKPDV